MRQHSFLIDGARKLAWTEWGEPDNPALLFCVHGLTRTGRDFDRIADALSDRYRVACIDMAGRGLSDPVPGNQYEFANYVTDTAQLLARLNPATLDWLGTSMGGLIGLYYTVAAPADAPSIDRLILNDVGPEVPSGSLSRIADYVGRNWRFADLMSAEQHVRKAYEPFALRNDADWRWFTGVSVRHMPDGTCVPAYDPVIGERFAAAADTDGDLWPIWDALTIPVLILRGEISDVLPETLAREMVRRLPAASQHVVPGVGHAPSLLYEDEIAPVRSWLLRA